MNRNLSQELTETHSDIDNLFMILSKSGAFLVYKFFKSMERLNLLPNCWGNLLREYNFLEVLIYFLKFDLVYHVLV